MAQANPSQLWPLGGDTLDLPAGNEMIQVCKSGFLSGDVGGLTSVFQGPCKQGQVKALDSRWSLTEPTAG